MKITVYALVCLLSILCLHSCGPKETKQASESAVAEPEITREIVPTKNGAQRLQLINEGIQMPHGKIKAKGAEEFISTQRFENKPLVINFWASWCKPCLTDTPAFQKMATNYPGAQFISVSIDKEEAVWNTFLKDEQWTGNHYWLGMNESEPFYSFVYTEVQSEAVNGVHVALPKYVIIDASGTIVTKSFPGPGTPLFKETLDKYLL